MSEQKTDAVAKVETEKPTFEGMMRQAETLIASGFLPQAVNTPAKAVAIILTGRELGIPTMQALRQINVIQGKPTMAAELMLALAYSKIPGFRATVIKSNENGCAVEFQRPDQPAYQHIFTLDDAKRLGLADKDNYKKQCATMLRWRCISGGLRVIAPDAIAGIYTPEEINPDLVIEADGRIREQPEIKKPVPRLFDKTPKQGDSNTQPPQAIATPGASQGMFSEPVAPKNANPPENLNLESPPPEPQAFKTISKAQQKRMFALCDQQNISGDTLHKHLAEGFGIEHSKDILVGDYDRICEWIENGGQELM